MAGAECREIGHWREVLADSPQLSFVMTASGEVVAASRGMCGALGMDAEKLAGRTCYSLMHKACERPPDCPLRGDSRPTVQRCSDVHSDVLAKELYVTVTPLPALNGNGGLFLHVAADRTERRRIEDALRASEAHHREILSNAPIGMFELTTDGRLVYGNPALARLFGYESMDDFRPAADEAPFAGATLNDSSNVAELAAEVRRADGSWLFREISLRREDGENREAAVTFTACPDMAGEEVHLFGFVHDITEERMSRRALEKSATLLKEAESLAHLGSWEWDVNEGVVHYSEEWQRIHGVKRNLYSMDELMPICHPDDQERVQHAIDAVVSRGEAYRVSHRIIRVHDGSVRHVDVYGQPVFDEAGRVDKVYGATLDVTEHVLATLRVQEREASLRAALTGTIAALGAVIELRDPYTAGHQQRVAQLADAIAGQLGWDGRTCEVMHTAALLHDVGKITVPSDILSKPSRLSGIEYELIKEHAAAARGILSKVAFEGPVVEIIEQHHERLDGSGYPYGLSGDQILRPARVLAVADVFEAMVTHRPYRAALSPEVASAELRDGAGRRYDPSAVAVCLQLIQDGFEFAPVRQ